MTNLLKNTTHLKHIKKKTNIARSILFPIMNSSSGVCPDVKLMCYKQLIRPQMTYGFPIWFNISMNQMKKLQVLERKCLRNCINFQRTTTNFRYIKNTELYEKTKIEKIENHLFKLFENFTKKLNYIPNELIQKLARDSINIEHQTLLHMQNYHSPTSFTFLNQNNRIFDEQLNCIYYTQNT